MKRTLPLLLLLTAVPLFAAPAEPDLQADLDSLVAAERAFSKTSEEQGTKAAFLANLADDSILFRPGPILGRPWTEARPAPPGLLTWFPVKADIARSGDLGYSTGPWEARPKGKDDTNVLHGNYVTIWKKREDGTWKLVTDIGNVNPKPTAATPEALRLDLAEVRTRGGVESPATAEASLLAADRAFGDEAKAKGMPAGYAGLLTDDARVLRNGAFPVTGKDAIRAFLTERKVAMSWEPLKAGTSRAGDFGYTYGTYEETAAGNLAEKGHYLRIWKKQGGDAWKLVLDITSPLPPSPH
ncbi:MAG TPA: nuclear transport factor 2 family protein [Thermoanaerobaculia bacterium]|jgi:ketosteroid isomerase-like protein|nr:nuclear transport factor 2 family protein [Thermoanaerobaculia bacterium]